MDQVSKAESSGAALPRGAERVDGRRQRSARTRQAIIVAYLALVQKSQRLPTMEQVAREANLSGRAIFAHFADRVALGIAAFDQILAVRKSTPADGVITADRRTRIQFQVEVRARNCEQWLPLWRVVTRNTAQSPEVAERAALVRGLTRTRLELMYRPELETLNGPDRAATMSALEAVVDYESWGRMREDYGFTYEAACAAWIRIIDRLLPPTP